MATEKRLLWQVGGDLLGDGGVGEDHELHKNKLVGMKT
jgi:hypothetical protein